VYGPGRLLGKLLRCPHLRAHRHKKRRPSGRLLLGNKPYLCMSSIESLLSDLAATIFTLPGSTLMESPETLPFTET
jgi:hypothetical protein